MADWPPGPREPVPRPPCHRILRAEPHASGATTKLIGFLALAVTLAALLVLAGATLAAAAVALVFLSPLLLLTCPLWLPAAAVLFFAGGAALSACVVAVVALAAGTWAHRHLTGRHPVSAHRHRVAVDARGRVSGYYAALDYGGGYPRGREDAAPGA